MAGSDFLELEKFAKELEGFEQKHHNFLESFLLEMAMRTLAKTKKLTPVDTGNLRNKWEVSNVVRVGKELQVHIFNPEEYASHVEDGHRQRKRFLPLRYLMEGTPKSKKLGKAMVQKYGKKTATGRISRKAGPNGGVKGIMLKDKWIPGVHMARISISQIERELPARYNREFTRFLKSLGMS